MGLRFASCRFLFLLLAATFICGGGIRTIAKVEKIDASSVLRLHNIDVDEEKEEVNGHKMRIEHVHVHPSSPMDHIDPSLIVFFRLKDLKVGKVMPIYFPKRDPLTSPKFLPKEEADSIPFSSKQIHHLLQFFSFSEDSPQAKAIEDTIGHCESKSIEGETKFCATSLESLLDFIRGIFELDTHLKVLTTTHLTKSNTNIQNYTIMDVPKQVFAPKMVACHSMPYPYAVFYCHSQESENRVFDVPLVGENGDLIRAIAVCHMDTSHWSRNHASFRVLGVQPGTSPVCHFFPADNLVWVPTSNLN